MKIALPTLFDNAVQRVSEAIKTKVFCKHTDIDVHATMKAKCARRTPRVT